jgi:ComEC/Rec2-related protein
MTLLVLCAAAITGLVAGELARLDRLALLIAIGTSGAAALLSARRPAWRLVALAGCAAAAGALRVELVQPLDGDPLANFTARSVTLHGQISSVPTRTERSTRFLVSVTSVNSTAVQARVAIIADPHSEPDGQLHIGDAIAATGKLITNQGAPARALIYPRVSLIQRAEPSPLLIGAQLRTAAIASIQRQLPEPQASLAAGVLLGGSGRLDAEFRGQLQRSGLAHIVAIDGYKQVLVTAAVSAAAVHLIGRRFAAAPIVLGIIGYTVLTGARPSAIRAGLMVGMANVAGVVGRLPDSLTSLLVAAVLMVGFEPDVLLDVGFQLSFTATLGLILLWPRLRRLLRGVPPIIGEPAGITFTVTIATLPVMLCVFQSVSLISPLAHIVAMPLLPPVLLATVLLPLTERVPILNAAMVWLAWLPSTALAEITRVSGDLPGAALSTGQLPPAAAVGLGLLLLGWGLLEMPEAADVRARLRTLATERKALLAQAALVAAGGLGLGLLLITRADGQLHTEHLHVAPGQAILIRTPTGRTALVAGGRVNAQAMAGEVAERLPLWEHGLGLVVMLDDAVEPRLRLMLERYPAEQLIVAYNERIELGGGAALDTYAGTSAAISSQDGWLRLIGNPPPPPGYELRSGPTTSAATRAE